MRPRREGFVTKTDLKKKPTQHTPMLYLERKLRPVFTAKETRAQQCLFTNVNIYINLG